MEETGTLHRLFFDHVAPRRSERLLTWHGPSGVVTYSSRRFVTSVLALRRFLESFGFEPSQRIAIFSENRPEWHIADFAIAIGGHIVVPIYATLSPPQVEYLLHHSGCRAAIIGGTREWSILEPLLPNLPALEQIIHIDDGHIEDGPAPSRHSFLSRIESQMPDPDSAMIERERARCVADPDRVASIVYTSGTTATPKGVLLTHGNLMFDLDQCLHRLQFREVRQALSVLPLAHVYERILCYGYFRLGIPIAYGDPYQLKELLPLHRPEVMGCVPRILEKMRDAIEKQIDALPSWKKRFVGRILHGQSKPSGLIDRFLASRIRSRLGGVRYFICGGAWLNPAVEAFFRGAGFMVIQGYGMTETSPVITLAEMEHQKAGSAGRALDGVELRIAEDGEIQTRGRHVMLGYFNDGQPDRQSIQDGWLPTGDLGRLDEEGFLFITGRKKDLLVLSNGKNISCAALEKGLARSRMIQDVFVMGEGRNYTVALIVPHRDNVAQWARDQGVDFSPTEDGLVSSTIIDLFRREIEMQQAEFSNFERVKRFCFLSETALENPELMTPTQKMRRAVLAAQFAPWIDRIYQNPEPFLIPSPRH